MPGTKGKRRNISPFLLSRIVRQMSLLDLNQAQLAEMVGANIGTLKTEEAELEKTRRAISRLLDPFA